MNNATRVLVVDDDPTNLTLYAEILRTEGYEVGEASTGQEGLRLTRETSPDLVLLDVMLPDLSGIEVCRQIKADAALQDVFVVLFSGQATSSLEKVDGLTAGGDDYIARPVAPHEFLARVRTILRLRDTTAALRASELHYRRLVEMLPEAVALLDPHGRLLAVNPRGVAMLGYANPLEVLGKSAFDLTPPEDHERVRADISTTLATGTLQTAQYTLISKEGHRFPTELSARVSTDTDGQPTGFVVVVRDITERKLAEKQIRLLADAMQSSTELICITDRENRLTFANQAFLKAYGYRREETLGKTPHFLYSPRNPPGLYDQVFQQTLNGGWNGEILNRTKDGTEFPIALSTSPIKDDQGAIIGLVGLARDISDRKRAEKRKSALAQLGYRLSAASAPDQAAKVIFEIASDLFNWDAGYYALYSPAEDRIIPILTFDTVGSRRTHFPPSSLPLTPTPLMRLVLQEGPRLLREAGELSPDVKLVPFGNLDQPAASGMFVPINSGGVVMGILSLQSYTPRAYSEEDLQLLQTLADHSGATLRRIEVTEALRVAEAKYRSIFEKATEGIFQTTPEGRFRIANPALVDMLGYASPEELIASVSDIPRQVYVKPERRRELTRRLELQGFVRGFEFELYHKDGSIIWVSVNAHAVRDASGTVLYYEGTIQDITKRKRAEDALEMSQILQAALLDNIPDPAWLKDAEGHYLACNEPLAKLFGRTTAQILGKTVFEVVPQEAARLTREDQAAMRSRRPVVVEMPMADAQGHLRWFETVKSPLFNEEEEVTGTVGISREVTERKWAENVLKVQRDFGILLSATGDLSAAAERLLQLALENEAIDCGTVYLVDPRTGAMDLVVQRGLSAGFIKHASHVVADSVQARPADPSRARSRRRGGPLAEVVRRLKREGLLALETVPMQHGGKVVAALNVGSHVHREIPLRSRQVIEAIAAQAAGAIARIRAEQSLHTHQQLLEKTLYGLHAAVLIVDARTMTIQECNPAATRIFGYSREQMIGQTPFLLHVNEALWAEFQRHFDAAVKEKGFLSEFEFRMRRKNGALFLTEQHLLPIRNEAAQVVTWVGVIRDVTERRRMEEGLREASRRIIEAQEAERQRVARELHDGVNQIIASAKMRLRKVEDLVGGLGPAGREILARCDRLLVQALEENRRIAHDLRPSDLDALGLTTACRNFCTDLKSRTNLAVKCTLTRLSESLPPAVQLNLFRIVQEALNNVARHARARTVRLQIAFQGDSVVLRIQDDGRGFDLKTPRPAGQKGHGVGLTNMRERAASLGGTCEVKSAPSQGTTIIVRVPCEKPQ